MQHGLEATRQGTRRSRDRRAVRTRNAITSATRELLATDRTAATVEDIARAAGVSRAAFYTHFTNVEEVVVLGLRDSFARIRSAQEFAAGEGDGHVSMVRSQRELVEAIAAERDLLAPLLRHPAGAALHEELAEAMAAEIRAALSGSSALPAGLDVQMTATYIASAATGLLVAWVRDTVVADRQLVVDHLMALMPSWLSTPAADG